MTLNKWVKNPTEINNTQKKIYKKYLNEYLNDRDIETDYYDQDDWLGVEIDFWNWLLKEKLSCECRQESWEHEFPCDECEDRKENDIKLYELNN